MNATAIPSFFSFFFGVLSIISPCVIVLLPAYFAAITGIGTRDILQSESSPTLRRRIVINALIFVTGFFLIFIPLGALIGLASQYIVHARTVIGIIGGSIILLLGIHALKPLPFLKWTQRDARVSYMPRAHSAVSILFFGATFAFVWTPCVGPYLLSVIAFVGVSGNIAAGMGYFALYSLGLASTLVLLALLIGHFAQVGTLLRMHARGIEIIGGIIFIVIGILMVTNQLYLTNVYINTIFNDFQPESWF